ncbi:iron-sulfur cluster biosynthesis family protein [uncultured Lactobacillus sp.]|uniref:iron-sulfur cluster biosynthesis family protein n=1 Tax=uncultured Lactobacillus sp. TaxID=153152 RepID=UPI00262E4B63|nr:iron-sulfur cluster biosynthesis family protein [uncultured Lactobacillus sp.]
MIDEKNLKINIKPEAQDVIKSKVQPNSVVLLALNDGSNGYSKLGGTCTIGADFQLVILEQKDPAFNLKIENNMGLDLYTSKDELQFLDNGLVLNARNSVLSLSSDEGIIDGSVSIDKFEGKKLSKEEMEKLGGKIC